MTRRGLAQVVHSLASSSVGGPDAGGVWPTGLVDGEDWQVIARHLLRLGCDWPAAVELADGMSLPRETVERMVNRLADQARQEMGQLAALPFWDTVCGLVARSWRLGTCDAVDAMYRLDGLWWLARDADRSTSQGVQLIWEGMGLKELSEHVDVVHDATALLAVADRLVAADVRDAQFCEAVVRSVW